MSGGLRRLLMLVFAGVAIAGALLLLASPGRRRARRGLDSRGYTQSLK
jgi:hypothetical protein